MAAEGFSYSYLEGSYTSVNLDADPRDADGFGLAASVGLGENFSIFADYDDLDVDGAEGGSLKHLDLGVGFHWGLSSNLDLTSGLSYESLTVAGPDPSGFGVAVGLRGRVGESLELTGGVKYIDLNKGLDGQTAFTIGARWYFTPNFAVGADFSDQDDLGKAWRAVLRYDFGGMN
jgi:hypothetical protein